MDNATPSPSIKGFFPMDLHKLCWSEPCICFMGEISNRTGDIGQIDPWMGGIETKEKNEKLVVNDYFK